MNNVMIVGRLVGNIETIEKNDIKHYKFVLAVSRSFKNEYGEYETDFIDIRTFGNIGETTKEYCRKGDLIGIKGRIQTETIENDDIKRKITYVVAEKVTFLSTNKKEEE